MEKRKGVLTLEAALVVPIFIFSIYFMMELISIISIYDSIQTNIYNTAKYINGYTYLTKTTGVADLVNDDSKVILV